VEEGKKEEMAQLPKRKEYNSLKKTQYGVKEKGGYAAKYRAEKRLGWGGGSRSGVGSM